MPIYDLSIVGSGSLRILYSGKIGLGGAFLRRSRVHVGVPFL